MLPLHFALKILFSKCHEFAHEDGEVYQVEFMFWCHLQEGAVAQRGHAPDEGQLEISWLEASRLDDYHIFTDKIDPTAN